MKAKHQAIKRLLACVLAICSVLTLSGCLGNDEKSFDSVYKHFLRDGEVIASAVENGRPEDALSLRWIESADESDGYVDFSCGGSGIGSQTNYTGFFYTPGDDPLAMWRKSGSAAISGFQETEDGWEYRESEHGVGGDNVFLVRKLAPCYYYYHLHF